MPHGDPEAQVEAVQPGQGGGGVGGEFAGGAGQGAGGDGGDAQRGADLEGGHQDAGGDALLVGRDVGDAVHVDGDAAALHGGAQDEQGGQQVEQVVAVGGGLGEQEQAQQERMALTR